MLISKGEGLYEGLEWLSGVIKNRPCLPPPPDITTHPPAVLSDNKILTAEKKEGKRMEDQLLEWIERQDQDDDIFLQELEDATLGSWDHYTHLRIAWLLLTRHGVITINIILLLIMHLYLYFTVIITPIIIFINIVAIIIIIIIIISARRE